MNSFRLFQELPGQLIDSQSSCGAPPALRPCPPESAAAGGRLLEADPREEQEADGAPNPTEARHMHTLVLADDHPVVRQSLKRLLCQQADLHLVGEASNGLDTLTLIKQLQPDLLVTDLMMPGMNGLEVTRRIRLSFPATRVVVVSVNGDEPYVAGALRCGASGFVLKTACGQHLLAAVRAVLAGRRFVSPPLRDPEL